MDDRQETEQEAVSRERVEAAMDLLGDRTLRDAAKVSGCTATTIHTWARGLPVSRRMLTQIANGLRATGERRARLFRAWGYVDPGAPTEPFDPLEYLQARRMDLVDKFGLRALRVSFTGIDANSTRAEIDERVEDLRAELERTA